MPVDPSDVAAPAALHDRAQQDLSFIRRTIEGASAFTDVPGWGLVVVGGLATTAAAIAARQQTPGRWIAVWVATAALAVAVGGAAMLRKMRRRGTSDGALVLSVAARKFLLGFWPAIIAGALLTGALIDPFTIGVDPRLVARVLPGLWLLLYGLGVLNAGAFSVRAVPLMGLGFLLLGALALFLPGLPRDVPMALGFGGLHLTFGLHIARRHGG